jgi:hypothetical protein
VFVGTWNVGNSMPDTQWLQRARGYDLVVLGCQEAWFNVSSKEKAEVKADVREEGDDTATAPPVRKKSMPRLSKRASMTGATAMTVRVCHNIPSSQAHSLDDPRPDTFRYRVACDGDTRPGHVC